ncbi:TPA: hypothetical protein ACFP4Y_002086 [Neisseria bacilliformis]
MYFIPFSRRNNLRRIVNAKPPHGKRPSEKRISLFQTASAVEAGCAAQTAHAVSTQ